MRGPSFQALALLAASAVASPTNLQPVGYTSTSLTTRNPARDAHVDLMARDDRTPLERKYNLPPRASRKTSSASLERRKDFDPATLSYSKQNDLLFEYAVDDTTIDISCLDCQVAATVTPTIDFDLTDWSESSVNLTFTNTQAYIDLEFLANTQGTHSFNLLTVDAVGFSSEFATLGLILYVDLVFEISSIVEVTGGFTYTIPDGSSIGYDLSGNNLAMDFDGAVLEDIPWELVSGSATITVALRVRAELGGSIGIDDEDEFEAEIGVYADIFEVVVELEETDTCLFETLAWWDINAGVYVNLGATLLGDGIGISPTASTTFYTGATASTCWESIASTTAPAGIDSTTAPAEIDSTTPPAEIDSTTAPASIPTTTSEIVDLEVSTTPAVTSAPVSWIVSGAPPITLNTSTPAVTWIVSGAPPITLSTETNTEATTTSASGISTITKGPGLHTSTVYSTTVYTITSCAASVINCPASWAQEIVVTKEVVAYTTICPVTEEQTLPTTTSTPEAIKKVTITKGVTASVCPTPIVHTFVSPSGVEPPAVKTRTITIHVPTTTAVETESAATSVGGEEAVETDYSVQEVVTSASSVVAVPYPTSVTSGFIPAKNATSTSPASVPSEVVTGGAGQKSVTTLVGAFAIIVAGFMAL
ncbi:hypothetical protein G7Z17_g410 [Cylindrodendrum hubeiense]|uniref:Uncharacterized protein n=1 Tax=Cylindrodendrum hubeiense TaxID=595255 RepID=A0A9P5LG85_9HYPO|nr:hypothetical protein G7Z17_g410 [Cylindrodendrum hubeiense]